MPFLRRLRQSFDQITKFAGTFALGCVFLLPILQGVGKRTAILAQLRKARIDFAKMFFAKLSHLRAGCAAVFFEVKDLLCLFEREPDGLSFLDEFHSPNRLRGVKPIVSRGALRFRQ